MLELEAGESLLLASDDDPQFAQDFIQNHPISDNAVFEAHFSTGRRWEPEKTESGGETIRVKPDPNLLVFDADSGAIVVLAVSMPNPLIFSAFHINHDDLEGFIERIVRSVDEDYEGIEEANVKHSTLTTEDLRTTISDTVEEILAEA